MTDFADVQEILQRVRRIETRQMVIGRALGLDPKTRRRIVIKQDALDITGFDISLGDVLDFCRKAGITGLRRVLLHGTYVGTLDVTALDRVSPPPLPVQEEAGNTKETHTS